MHIKTLEMKKLQLGIGNYSCNWGTHICGLYETEKERDEIILGYLGQGCIDNDMQIFIHSEQTESHFWHTLNVGCPGCSSTRGNPGRLDVKEAKELYYPEGVFDPRYMDEAVNGYYDYTQAEGPHFTSPCRIKFKGAK
jgi:hypothetical protein